MSFFAIAGAILTGASAISTMSTNSKMNALNEKEKAIELKGKIGELGAQEADTEDVIGVYEDYLKIAKASGQFDDLESLEGVESSTEVDARAKELYRQVYKNLGLSNVAAGAKGHIGGSTALLAGEVQKGVISDINTGASQLDVYQTSLKNIKEAKGDYIDTLLDIKSASSFKSSSLYETDEDFKAAIDKEIAEAAKKKNTSGSKGDRKDRRDHGYGWGDNWSGHREKGGKYNRDTYR